MKIPNVSIIIATYNASHILYYAIKSVLNQEYNNWELIVVGDCCTDNTKEIVNKFNDQRISYFNLPVNSGQQATPNNFGIAKARGKYIAFLNQDDMYLPWHIDHLLERAIKAKGEIICSQAIIIDHFEDCRSWSDINFIISPYHPKLPKFDPTYFYLASSWFFKKEIINKIGNWKLENELHVSPSQEWLFRAMKKGVQICCPNEVTFIAIPTGRRPNFYKNKAEAEHNYIYETFIASNENHAMLLASVNKYKLGTTGFGQSQKSKLRESFKLLYRKISKVYSSISGRHPMTIWAILRFGTRKGESIRVHNRKSGKN